MRRTTFLFSIICFAILLLGLVPVGLPVVSGADTKAAGVEAANLEPLMMLSAFAVDTLIETTLNSSERIKSYVFDVAENTLYALNWSLYADFVGSSDVQITISLNEDATRYVPQLDDYVPNPRNVRESTYYLPKDWSETNAWQFVTVNDGSMRVTVDMAYYHPDDSVSLNLSIVTLLSYDLAPVTNVGVPTTIEWTKDYSFAGTRIVIPEDSCYNLSLSSYLPYNTTASYMGDDRDFLSLSFIDEVHGQLFPWGSWQPWFSIPSGENQGTDWWSYTNTIMPLAAGEYYLSGQCDVFEYLNGTYINFTIFVEEFPMTHHLSPGGSVDLRFNESDDSTMIQMVVYKPTLDSMDDIFFENPQGSNWSVYCLDIIGMGEFPYFEYTTTSNYVNSYEWRLNDTFHMVMTGMGGDGNGFEMYPTPGPMGDGTMHSQALMGVPTEYDNETVTSAIMPMMPDGWYPYQNYWPTFFMLVEPSFLGISHSETFNITMKSFADPVQELVAGGANVSFNTTVGPFWHIFQMNVESGNMYEYTMEPTNYISYGQIVGEVMPLPFMWDDWGFVGYPTYLAKAEPSMSNQPGWMASNINDSLAIKFVPTKDETLFFIAFGIGDTNKSHVDIMVTPAPNYSLGDNIDLSLNGYDHAAYGIDIIEGHSYSFDFAIDSGTEAYAYFFDSQGVVPFHGMYPDLWAQVGGDKPLVLSETYTASMTGQITLVIVGASEISFSFDIIDNTSPFVEITSPSNNAELDPGNITIEFTASDDIGLKSLTLDINGTTHVLALDATNYTWNATVSGLYYIEFVAIDNYDNEAKDKITVLIGDHPGSYDSGYDDGEDDGYDTGYDDGEDDGYDEGYQEGTESGNETGYNDGYSQGLGDGYNQGLMLALFAGGGLMVIGLIIGGIVGKRRG